MRLDKALALTNEEIERILSQNEMQQENLEKHITRSEENLLISLEEIVRTEKNNFRKTE